MGSLGLVFGVLQGLLSRCFRVGKALGVDCNKVRNSTSISNHSSDSLGKTGGFIAACGSEFVGAFHKQSLLTHC